MTVNNNPSGTFPLPKRGKRSAITTLKDLLAYSLVMLFICIVSLRCLVVFGVLLTMATILILSFWGYWPGTVINR